MGQEGDTLFNPLNYWDFSFPFAFSLRFAQTAISMLSLVLLFFSQVAFHFAHCNNYQASMTHMPTPSSLATEWQSTVAGDVKLCRPVPVQIHAVQLQLHFHNYKHKHMKSPQAVLWQLPRVLLNSEEHYEIALKKICLTTQQQNT